MSNQANHNSQFSTFNSQPTLNFQRFWLLKAKKIEFRFVNSNIICIFALAK